MMVFNAMDYKDGICEVRIMIERVSVLMTDILNGFLCPLDEASDKPPLELATIAAVEAHRNKVKAEIADGLLAEIESILDQLSDMEPAPQSEPKTAKADPPEDSAPIIPTEQEMRTILTDEMLNSVVDFIPIIESKPDYCKRMETLKQAAMELAAGFDVHIVSDMRNDIDVP